MGAVKPGEYNKQHNRGVLERKTTVSIPFSSAQYYITDSLQLDPHLLAIQQLFIDTSCLCISYMHPTYG